MTPSQPPIDPRIPQLADEIKHEPLPLKQPDKPAASQNYRQLVISDREKGRLKDRIWNDFLGSRSNHDRRIMKFRRIWRMWRGLNVTMGSRTDGPDFQVPLIKWTTFAQWARCMQALLGDDAEIIAEPRTPEGDKTGPKVGRYMSWRFFEYMQAVAQLSPFVFRSILFGRAHAEIIYEQEFYQERDEAGNDKEVLCYDGPKLRALWPSQLILPAQDDCSDVTQFAWKIRRDRLTPEQLLDGERKGRYQGIRDNWTEIMGEAQQRQERDFWWDDERIDSDEAEGVDHTTLMGTRDSIEVWRWYGKWRLPTSGRDAKPENLDWRQPRESDLLVTYLPKPGLVVGVQDLRDLYPRMRKRDPFVDLAMVKDGSYWPPGMGEMLEDIQNELTINHALFRKAGQLSVGPIIFYKPSSGGFDPSTFEYKPMTAIPCEDPSSVKTVSMQADLTYSEAMQHLLKSIAELVTGVSDNTTGIASDRPNAPKTASGQAMLLQEGNVRASLDMSMLKDDLSRVLSYIWELDCEYASEQVFFRVTGDDADGLFDVQDGFGTMTSEDREHSFSFDLKFATSVWSREAKKAVMLQLYQLSVMNPLVMTNPKALWSILNRLWTANGEKDFKDIIPEPPETDRPKTPKEEWGQMLAGEEVHVNPLDDDMQHLNDHRNRLAQAVEDGRQDPARADRRLMKLAIAHIVEHEQQRKRKMLLQELVQAAAQQLQQSQEGPATPFGSQAPMEMGQAPQAPQAPTGTPPMDAQVTPPSTGVGPIAPDGMLPGMQ